MADFNSYDVGGYLGDNVEIWVFNPYHEDVTPVTPTGVGYDYKSQLRGATSFETTEEVSQETVKELGYSAAKILYGIAEYKVSITLTVRDLLNIARMAGISDHPDVYGYINVSDFKKVNLLARYKDPNTGTVSFTKYVGGFRSASCSTPVGVDSTAEITLEGGAELIVSLDSDCDIVQHEGDGTNTAFDVPTIAAASEILLVESPAGVINTATTDYTVDTVENEVEFVTAPADGSTVRIAVSGWETTNIVS